MPKGIEEADVRFSAIRLALQALVDALAEKGVIERTDITDRLREREQHMGDLTDSAELVRELENLRRLLG